MNWQEEFNQAMEIFNFKEPDTLEYRLHYNDQGTIVMCSMVDHPENTQYLIVDRATYDQYFKHRVNVEKKELEKIEVEPLISVKLRKSDQGHRVVKNHAGLILDNNESHQDIEHYETNR